MEPIKTVWVVMRTECWEDTFVDKVFDSKEKADHYVGLQKPFKRGESYDAQECEVV